MGIAAAALGWRPREFWESTPVELAGCLEGWTAMNCTSDDP